MKLKDIFSNRDDSSQIDEDIDSLRVCRKVSAHYLSSTYATVLSKQKIKLKPTTSCKVLVKPRYTKNTVVNAKLNKGNNANLKKADEIKIDTTPWPKNVMTNSSISTKKSEKKWMKDPLQLKPFIRKEIKVDSNKCHNTEMITKSTFDNIVDVMQKNDISEQTNDSS
jgi:hypothetical protein